MGEFKVHRVRFFNYIPSGIRCMAYNSQLQKLALARLDGSVEIFNFSNNYFQEKVIPGNEARSIEAICWVGHDRLFSAGLNGEIIEYDLVRLCPKYTLDAFGGPIWALASNASNTHLAVGCEDGSVKLFEILPEKIQFERNLDRQKGRILSLSWHKSGTQIAVGSLDVIRVFSVKSGHAVQRILVDRCVTSSHNRECMVWSIGFLSDYTIVSADSTGKVQFWDSEKGTLIKTHPIAKSDVLSLAVAEPEDSIVVGTSEGTVVQFQFLPLQSGQQECQWLRTKTFKYHTHDVRAVVHTKTDLISGGLDTHLVIRPLMNKLETKSYEAALRKVTFPHRCLVSCAKKANLLLFQFPDQLELWRLGTSEAMGEPGDTLPVSKKPEKLLQLKRKGQDNIHCSAVSPCGGWLAYSTISALRLYRLQYENDNISINRVSRVPKVVRSAHQLLFSVDSKRLFVASDQSSVHLIDLSQSDCKHLHTFKPKSGTSEPVVLLAASVDGKWLAAASHTCEIEIYNLKQLKHHCTVPLYNCIPSAMAIHPQTNNLVIAYADQQIFEFSIPEKQYTDWSRKLQQQGLHILWMERDTPLTNVTFNPKEPSQIFLHDTYMICIIDKTLPLPCDQTQLYNQLTLKNVPEQLRQSQVHAFKICKLFQPLLHADLLDDDWLVVVERPLMDIYSQLPPPIRQKKFGT
ncbi:U3 small nucleolar RNA-associated protein 4 homolog [Latimeria chalumnae]|uniref:U3 small nucleolar RNA-associated protein 4 homolog n=1 Tax=Latimeria chalumnae TaxID=7897 RepID=UPI0006D9141F|nr:PREDICTED: cirhin [Latimeria chalumnae]XP_014351721.1 PREDICTED: cirhin [Latimeria chalumnae]|eukprot:XP_014351720.1 PREDICTED: cirhin [Latimeria chalumnae]